MSTLVGGNPAGGMGMREFNAFRTLIHHHSGIWLRDGKQIMLASRLGRRLRQHRMSEFTQYYEHVQHLPADNEEIRELINCVTTNKTSFFRERHHFEFLAKTVVAEVYEASLRGGPRQMRVWSAACSTGEEPYTIAITLLEALEQLRDARRPQSAVPRTGLRNLVADAWKIEVVASDIDTKVLNTAQRAIYPLDSLESVPQALRKKYFLRGTGEMEGQVKVKPEVSRRVRFIRVNLQDARWPLEGVFDVVFFRNALIYFNHETQDIFLRKMIRFLKPRGYLFLGNSEHIPWLHGVLEPLQQTMYRVRGGQPRK